MFLRDAHGLWNKIKNRVGVNVKHPISSVTREIRFRLSDEGVQKTVRVCPYCAVGCSTLGMLSREATTHYGCIDVSVSSKSGMVYRTDIPLVRLERALSIHDGGLHRNPHEWSYPLGVDTTADTTESATPRNGRPPPAKKPA